MNNHRRGWALRYLREARAELTAAQKTPYMAQGLVFEALKKAQAAIYYSLGDPAFVEAIVHQTMHKERLVEDPALRLLVEIERTIQQITQVPRSNDEKMMEQVDGIIRVASEIVELFTGESA